LPSLRTFPKVNNDNRHKEEQETAAEAQANIEASKNVAISRAERSQQRQQAIQKLERKGMNTWHERRAEKVASLQDLAVFRDSMWDSFFHWHDDYNAA